MKRPILKKLLLSIPPPSLVIKTFSTKEITSIIKELTTKKLSWV